MDIYDYFNYLIMNILSIRKILLLSLIFSLPVTVCEARSPEKSVSPGLFESLPAMPQSKKKGKVSRPKSAKQVQKDAEKKEKQQDKNYAKYVKENQKRSIEIQSPEVKERMKQNVKNANANYKAKKKNNAARSKKAGKKYR